MPRILQGLLTPVVTAALATLMLVLLDLALGQPVPLAAAALVGAIFGGAYGLQAGILLIYNLSTAWGWGQLIIDLTWSMPNTVFGFIFGNAIYIWFGWPTRSSSENSGWIVYTPRGSSGFGVDVLQTLGTLNLGGTGAHERVHLIQARIFGPLYLPVFGLNYVVNFFIQVLWTFTLGGLLWLVKLREKPFFRPLSGPVPGFFGWIYRATLFELWAYGTESH
jgi:hypothetical protein